MALTRPKEKHWEYTQPDGEQFPRMPGANGCFLAPSMRGKTTTMLALLMGPYRKVFSRVYWFSPNIHIDSAFDAWKEFNRKELGVDEDREKTMWDTWDEKALQGIIDRQHRVIEYQKKHKMKKMFCVCVIIDDWADRPDIMHKASNVITSLFIKGRHGCISTWLSSQALRAIHPTARANFKFYCVWKLNNAMERQKVIEELSALLPIKTLQAMYDLCTQERFGFWYIDLTAHDVNEMFYKGFDQRIVVHS